MFFFYLLIFFSVFLFKDLLKNEQDKVPKEISQKYYISRVLGQGACGIVKLVYNKVCIFFYACVCIKKLMCYGNNGIFILFRLHALDMQ